MKVIYLNLTLLKEKGHAYAGEITNELIDSIIKIVREKGYEVRMDIRDGDDGREYPGNNVVKGLAKQKNGNTGKKKKAKDQ